MGIENKRNCEKVVAGKRIESDGESGHYIIRKTRQENESIRVAFCHTRHESRSVFAFTPQPKCYAHLRVGIGGLLCSVASALDGVVDTVF